MSVDFDHEEAHEEPWLVSYADMMTLLFGFFVIMFSFATAGEEEFEKVRKELAVFFGGDYMTPYEDMKKELVGAINNEIQLKDIEIKITENGLTITFKSTVLFASGQAELRPSAEALMTSLIKVIRSKGDNFFITVEGHTDNVPIDTILFQSNWTLSGARASTVVGLLEKFKFNPERLKVEAFGETRPAFPNQDEQGKPLPENQAKNRRVVIHVLAPPETLAGAVDSDPSDKEADTRVPATQ